MCEDTSKRKKKDNFMPVFIWEKMYKKRLRNCKIFLGCIFQNPQQILALRKNPEMREILVEICKKRILRN